MNCRNRIAARFFRVGACLLFALLAGCDEGDGIRQYTVPHQEVRKVNSATSQEIPPANVAWFFKILGPANSVENQLRPFTSILRTLHFDAQGEPEIELPEKWTKSAGPPPRYQTLAIPDTTPPLELAISFLPNKASDFEDFLLANVNRWRGQLKLEPLQGDDWLPTAEARGEVVVVPTDTRTIVVVNLVGQTADFGDSRILAAMVTERRDESPLSAAPRSSATPSATTPPPLSYSLPEGWKASSGDSIRLAIFQISHPAGAAEVSVTRLGGGGEVTSNVNRWRQQVGLPPEDDAAIERGLVNLIVSGRPATLAEAVGEKQSILAAIVPDGDAKWFVKLVGPKVAVEAERERFRLFLDSVKFPEH